MFVHIQDLEKLLVKDSKMEFSQEKWFKKVFESDIQISEVAYQLKVTSNKRAPIYTNGIYSDTLPYSYGFLEKQK